MAAKEGMTSALAIGIIFMLIQQGVASTFRVTNLDVPPHVVRYTNQTLTCSYDLGKGNLYAIKWYHNDEEFFRYIPKEEPPIEVFNVTGIQVIEDESNDEQVVLREVDLSAAGEYKCEVNLDWPEFRQTAKSSNMTVVVIPLEQPNIEGDVEARYSVGDRVHLNCTAAPSTPPAALVWLINDQEAPKSYLRHYEHRKVEDGLLVSNLGLNFLLKKSDFIKGELKLKCTATIATFYHRSDEHSQIDPTATVKEVRNKPPVEGNLVTSTGASGCDSVWTSSIHRLLGFHVMVLPISLLLLW